MSDKDPIGLYSYLFEQLNKRNIGFVEITEGKSPVTLRETFKKKFNGTYISNGGMT